MCDSIVTMLGIWGHNGCSVIERERERERGSHGTSADSKKLEHGCGMIYAGVPSFFWFGVGGRSS